MTPATFSKTNASTYEVISCVLADLPGDGHIQLERGIGWRYVMFVLLFVDNNGVALTRCDQNSSRAIVGVSGVVLGFGHSIHANHRSLAKIHHSNFSPSSPRYRFMLRHSAPQWHRAPASAHSCRNLLPSGPSGAATRFPLLRSGRVNWRRHHCVAARGFRYGVRSSWTPWGGPVQHCGVSSAHSSPRDRSDQLSNVLRSPRHQGRRFAGGDKRVSACQSSIWIIVLFSPRHVF